MNYNQQIFQFNLNIFNELGEKMKKTIVMFIHKFTDIIKHWGIFGVFAIITLYTPLWLGYIIQSTKLISFGWKWAAIWALPIPPAWLAIILLATIYKWIYLSIIKILSIKKKDN